MPNDRGRTDVSKAIRWGILAPAALLSLGLGAGAHAQESDMSFFIFLWSSSSDEIASIPRPSRVCELDVRSIIPAGLSRKRRRRGNRFESG